MVNICAKELCTACGACMNICARDAISMKEHGALGFVYPVIDSSKCVDCGLCSKVCPVLNPVNQQEPLQSVAAVCKNDEDTKKSASGGAAYTLARYIIEDESGVVYGCELIDYKTIKHCRYTSTHDMDRMRGSKYVQSEIGLIYRQVKLDLQKGLTVLFTGTPCQIAGLRGYLRKEYDKLFCVDLVCHGVPSQKLLRDDVESMFASHNLKIPENLKTKFRSIVSNKDSSLEIFFGNFLWKDNSNDIIEIPIKDQTYPYNNYITAFMYGLTFRDNCFCCPYAQRKRASDVTIADYWGLGNDSIVPTGSGVSLLLPSTTKGQWLVDKAKKYLICETRSVEEAIRGNGQLQHPSKSPKERNTFVDDYEKISGNAYDKVLRKYRKESILRIKREKALKKYINNRILYLAARIYYKILNETL